MNTVRVANSILTRKEPIMTIAALSWPEAAVLVATIIAVGLVLSVAVWQIFRTGQTAIRHERKAA
jgi:cytochrome c-type biogenesis protein CcmH/NrfG